MVMPRRDGYTTRELRAPAAPEECALLENALSVADEASQPFAKLLEAMDGMRVDGDKCQDLVAMVGAHPHFQMVMDEYMALMGTLMLADNPRDTTAAPPTFSVFEVDDDLEEGLHLWIASLQRRRRKAEEFAELQERFLRDYEQAVQDLAAADPVLKGTPLAEKIVELARHMKRKYGDRVDEFQKECCNKKRRPNLSPEATKTLKDWFTKHKKHPYPTDAEKEMLAEKCGITELQLNNWFVNVRKRYWTKR